MYVKTIVGSFKRGPTLRLGATEVKYLTLNEVVQTSYIWTVKYCLCFNAPGLKKREYFNTFDTLIAFLMLILE